jgi:hypothetical protein
MAARFILDKLKKMPLVSIALMEAISCRSLAKIKRTQELR